MYKQTLCVTLPISAAVIIAATLFANAGELDPPKGPIEPTMHTLEEIYSFLQQSSPCGACTWEYWSALLSQGQPVEAIEGAGVLHGLWLEGSNTQIVRVYDGPPSEGNAIGRFRVETLGSSWAQSSRFIELNIAFANGIHVESLNGGGSITLLHRPVE